MNTDSKKEQTEQCTTPVVVDSFCRECGDRTNSIQHFLCDDCEEYIDSLDDPYWEDEYEPDYMDFDCICGAWQWDKNKGKPIHVADCVCGSSEPW